jgi:ABC-type amino acid transport substrate-binding protein
LIRRKSCIFVIKSIQCLFSIWLFSFLFFISGCAEKEIAFVPLQIEDKKTKTLRVGISPDYPPLAFKEKGNLTGAEVEMATTLAYYLNVKIVFVESPWDRLIPNLLNDRIDVIMSGLSITPERESSVNFVQPYMKVGQMALVRQNEKKLFPNKQSLLNTHLRVGFLPDTTSASFVKANFNQAQLTPIRSVEQAVNNLRKGKIDLFIHDAPTIWMIAGNSTEEQLTGLFWPLTEESLAWAVRPSDINLQTSLNDVLEKWEANGVLQKILNRWMRMRIEIEE